MADAVETAPFFVVGCPRSGTTLLQALLDAHPHAVVAPETFFVRDVYRTYRERVAREGRPAWMEAARTFAASAAVRDAGVDPGEIVSWAEKSDMDFGALFGRYLALLRLQAGALRVGEKTPQHLRAMRTLERWFPGARFVAVVRDPRAVAASWRDVPWSNGSLEADAAVWLKYARHLRRKPPRRKERLLVVRYETLLGRPEETVRRVLAHIELSFDPAALDPAGADAGRLGLEREPWRRAARRSLDPSRAEAWRRRLTTREVKRIERVVWPEMERWGYRPLSSRVRLLLARCAGGGA